MKNNTSRIAALFAAGALTLSGVGFVASTAVAQDQGAEPPLPPAAAADLIPADATGTLNIHKYEGDPEAGYVDAAPLLPPLAGVTFDVQRVQGIDLSTQQGWADLAGITAADLGGFTAGPATAVTTEANGLATFTGAVGVYLVSERGFGDYSIAPPFLVTLPYAGENGEWVYTRDVYPKNQEVKPNKQVDDNGATIGTNLSYTINAPVPAGAITEFVITDPLDASLALQTGSVAVTTTPDAGLVAGTDYTVATDNNTLVVTFTESGRAKLETARQAAVDLTVSVAFDAQVVSIPAGGVIANTATVTYPNGLELDTDVDTNGDGTPESPTSTTFGDLIITKTGTDLEAGDSLAGAVFEVYHCSDQDELLGEALTIATSPTGPTTSALTTVGADGAAATVTGYGLPASSFAGGDTGVTANNYCVLETQAPDGFVRNPEPQPVSYNAASNSFTVTVNNQRDSVFGQLPATGAWGIVIAFLIGLALLARGIYTSYRDNKATA